MATSGRWDISDEATHSGETQRFLTPDGTHAATNPRDSRLDSHPSSTASAGLQTGGHGADGSANHSPGNSQRRTHSSRPAHPDHLPQPSSSASVSMVSKSERPSHTVVLQASLPRGSRSARLWWREILACVLFVAALLALFATLYAYSNRPSPDWPSWLSLNTIVAIYAVSIKTGILLVVAEGIGQLKWSWFAKGNRSLYDVVRYDDATRGPWGATVLLWRLRAGDGLSCLGALIVILCLATDPFAQQIIHYYDCPVYLQSFSSAPRTNYYRNLDGMHTGAGTQTLSPAIMRSVLAGVFSPVNPPAIQCSTGNCTWPRTYSTLAYCSACEDVTNEMTFSYTTFMSYNTSQRSWNYTTSLSELSLSIVLQSPPDPNEMVNYAEMGPTPPKLRPDSGRQYSASMDFLLARNFIPIYDNGNNTSGPNFRPTNLGTGLPVEGCNLTTANHTWPCLGYGASRCSLFPCIKTLSARIEAGRVTETMLDMHSDWGYDAESLTTAMLDCDCLTDSQRNILASAGYEFTQGRRWQAYSSSPAQNVTTLDVDLAKRVSTERLMDQGCLYAIDMVFQGTFMSWLEQILTGVVWGYPLTYTAPTGDFRGPQTVQSFFNFGEATFEHVDSLFSNISRSFTNYMRQNGVNYSKPGLGSEYEMKTCIAVRWEFLAFPSALVLLALLFFTTMLRATRVKDDRPQIWKSSPLALLYHGLSDGGPDVTPNGGACGPERLIDMETLAKKTEVRLKRSQEGTTRLEYHGQGQKRLLRR